MPNADVVSMSFNPRSHEGSDCRICHRFLLSHVSIHAPTKGATRLPASTFLMSFVSIHAPTKGATSVTEATELYFQFQSTLPRRERHNRFASFDIYRKFQSTLPRRERHIVSMPQCHSFVVSIHAPTKGAT